MPTVGYSGVHKALVTEFNRYNLWGKLLYAIDERGYVILDAVAAALMVKSQKVAYDMYRPSLGKTVQKMDFHSTSVHGIGSTDHWPQVGQLVDVHLNDNGNLVAVWYQD